MTDDSEDRQPIGEILDRIGVTASLEENQHIIEALVLAKVSDFADGSTSVGIYYSVGMDWISQLGLFRASQLIMELAQFSHTEDE